MIVDVGELVCGEILNVVADTLIGDEVVLTCDDDVFSGKDEVKEQLPTKDKIFFSSVEPFKFSWELVFKVMQQYFKQEINRMLNTSTMLSFSPNLYFKI